MLNVSITGKPGTNVLVSLLHSFEVSRYLSLVFVSGIMAIQVIGPRKGLMF